MKTKPEDFQPFINRMMADPELKSGLESDHLDSERQYQQFKKNFLKGKCYLCGENITRCDYSKPCIHWLLRAHKRIKKKNIEEALKTKELNQIIAYLRWVANFEENLSQINDFEAYEKRDGLVYQETIKYSNLSWTFWIKEGDLNGHTGKQIDFPHYHLHMTIDGKNFISFGEMHLPLTEYDIFVIYARIGKYPKIGFITPHGESFSDIFNFIPKEELLDGMVSSGDDTNAPFHLQTFIEAKPGKMLKGEDIAKIVKEHNETKIPLAVLAKKLDANTKVMISPNKLVDPVLREESKKGR
ncbi:MAG: hypothetical protein KIH89_002255 [Candidatus Shapirobacteria bacterium]|nr:hypothetical protein [Candidatus Shapirobacteria bacterium]